MVRRIHRESPVWYMLWTMAATLLLLAPHLVYGAILTPSLALNQYGPAAGLLLFGLSSRQKGLWQGVTRPITVGLPWVTVAVAAPMLVVVASGLLLGVWQLNWTPWRGGAGFYTAEALAMLLGCTAEEIGWRGYLLPALRRRHSLLVSSLLVGALWGVWHLQVFQGFAGFFWFTTSIALFSVFLGWVYEKCGGNLLPAVLGHFCFNLFSHVLLWQRLGIPAYIAQTAVFAVLDIVLICWDRKTFFARPTASTVRQPAQPA